MEVEIIRVNDEEIISLIKGEGATLSCYGMCSRCQNSPTIRRDEDHSLLGLVRGKGPEDPRPRSDGDDDRR